MRAYFKVKIRPECILLGTALAFLFSVKGQVTSNDSAVISNANYFQIVRGAVLDGESRQPLQGVTVTLFTNPITSVLTNKEGYFEFTKVPLGRQSFLFTMSGFEPFTASSIEVIAGKTSELNISLKENFRQLKEVVVKAGKNRTAPVNEFAMVSARSFSVDETRRYAASVADPARMALNFPGVSTNGDDNNDIVVRGNSPKGILWRLEGIEIPNPNHFSSLGNSGGSISMLNANLLGSSDFYTGAFAPEIGNALSGVFDLYLRNGNTERYEHTIQLGTLGMEFATEGPFKKGKKGSYLLSYRYSTFALIKNFIDLGETAPNYQDLSFKINLPTKKVGIFSLFGLGGLTKESQMAIADSSLWYDENDNVSFSRQTYTGVAGISHQYLLNSKSYIRSILSASLEKTVDDVDTLNPDNSYTHKFIERTSLLNNGIRASVLFNHKLDANHTYRAGAVVQRLGYDLNYSYYSGNDSMWMNILSGRGNTWFYQGFLEWKAKLSQQLTATGGLHASYYALNRKASIEPRFSFSYILNNTRLTLAAGWHSKPEHISTYLFLNPRAGQSITHPNRSLDLLRAFHLVAGVERNVFKIYTFRAEVYYQRLSRIPVEQDSLSGFSILNAENLFSLIQLSAPLVSRGTGLNYGIDLSIERPLKNNFYMIVNTSLFKSTYTNFNGQTFNTRFNRSYHANIIAGKELKLNKSGRSLIGLNGKLLRSGGLRESLIDIDKSVQQGRTVYTEGSYYANQVPDYFRIDASIYVKLNGRRATHTIQFDVQNLTNRRNYAQSYFSVNQRTINYTTQLGLVPNLSYRMDFH